MERKGQSLWLLYACMLFLCFSKTTAAITRLLALPVQAYFLLTGLLLAAALLFVYLPVRFMAGRRQLCPEWLMNRGKMLPIEWLVLAALSGGLVFVRLFLAPAGALTDGQFCFDRALRHSAYLPESFFLGDLYIWLLHWEIVRFGQSDAVLLSNLILQGTGCIFLFFGVRRLSGPLPASLSVLTVVLLPAFSNSAYAAEPQSLFFACFGLLLYLGVQSQRSLRQETGLAKAGAAVCLTGLLDGALLFTDFCFLGILLFYPFAAFLLCKKRGQALLSILTWLVSTVSGFFGMAFAAAIWESPAETVFSVMGLLLADWYPASVNPAYLSYLHSPTLTEHWQTLFLYLLAVFVLMKGTERTEKTENSGVIWVAPLCFYIGMQVITSAALQEQGVSFALFGIMAGHGILVTLQPGDRKEALTGEKEEMWKKKEKNGDTAEAVFAESGLKEQETPKPGEHLANPLPVPKRRAKKNMEYGFEPEPDQMYYELPVADNDDFDV